MWRCVLTAYNNFMYVFICFLIPDVNSPGVERIVHSSGMNPNEAVYMRIPLSKRIECDEKSTNVSPIEFIKHRVSEFLIQPIDSRDKIIPSLKTLGNFLIKFETKFIRQSSQSEEFNNIISTADRHLTLSVTWKGDIYENKTFVRSAFGQSFIQMRYLYETVSSLHASLTFGNYFQSVFDNNLSQSKQKSVNEDDWAIHNVSVTKRCYLEEESTGLYDDRDSKSY